MGDAQRCEAPLPAPMETDQAERQRKSDDDKQKYDPNERVEDEGVQHIVEQDVASSARQNTEMERASNIHSETNDECDVNHSSEVRHKSNEEANQDNGKV